MNGQTIADTTHAAATCAVAIVAIAANVGSAAATAAGVATAFPAVDPVASPIIGSSLNNFKKYICPYSSKGSYHS